MSSSSFSNVSLFFFTHSACTSFSTLSLHDALPIFVSFLDLLEFFLRSFIAGVQVGMVFASQLAKSGADILQARDRKSTRLNSSHQIISYAVFCLKKKNRPCRVTWNSRISPRNRTPN